MRRRGFTLIELLVVIAIIGILAAMLFPVFARARESARKIQCLSNVKNIALAVQMYLTDYDKLWPTEHNQAVADWLSAFSCGNCDRLLSCRGTASNPYLRVPVILDEYIKNRDVWKCPSAMQFGQQIVINPGRNGDWLAYETSQNASPSGPCPNALPCHPVFPPGWGGMVTDTIAQGWAGCANTSDPGVFDQNYGTPTPLRELATGAMNDPAKYVVVADAGKDAEIQYTSQVAYPDVCRINTVACAPNRGGGWVCGGDWVNCSWSQQCSAQRVDQGGTTEASTSVQYRKDHFHSRHLGGSNIGFADGHAKWMASEKILVAGWNWSGYADGTDDLDGLAVCFNPTTKVTNP